VPVQRGDKAVKLEDIPRRQEVLIVAEAQQRIDRAVVSEHFDRRVASFAEVAHVARAVWIGTLRGTPMTAEQIANTIGMPRATVLGKLRHHKRRGDAVARGHSGENERLFDMVGIAPPSHDAGRLLGSVIQRPSHLA
jgi:hypothetical protein